MKKLMVLVVLVSSFSALADSSQCRSAYASHFERVRLLVTLLNRQEISPDFYQARTRNESEMMEVLIPIVCKGVSKNERKDIQLETFTEAGIPF